MVALRPFAPDLGRSFIHVVGTSQANNVMLHFQLVSGSALWLLSTVGGPIFAFRGVSTTNIVVKSMTRLSELIDQLECGVREYNFSYSHILPSLASDPAAPSSPEAWHLYEEWMTFGGLVEFPWVACQTLSAYLQGHVLNAAGVWGN